MKKIKYEMCKLIRQIWWIVIPFRVRQKIRNVIIELRYGKRVRNELYERIATSEGEEQQEFKKICNRIKTKPIAVYNYNFCDNYGIDKFVKNIGYDAVKKMYYGDWDGKRLYISKLYNTVQMAAKCISGIYMEQDMESPHRYVTDKYPMTSGGILLDIGGAEGFFPLDYFNNYEHVYIFENDPLWVEALKYTYEAYSDKVEIVEKYVSDQTNGSEISIDSFLENHIVLNQVTIKIDVEGAEERVLKGSKETFKRAQEVSLYIAAYHRPEDAEVIIRYLDMFRYEFSKGYMINLWENPMQVPFFRKGIIRARKGECIV